MCAYYPSGYYLPGCVMPQSHPAPRNRHRQRPHDQGWHTVDRGKPCGGGEPREGVHGDFPPRPHVHDAHHAECTGSAPDEHDHLPGGLETPLRKFLRRFAPDTPRGGPGRARRARYRSVPGHCSYRRNANAAIAMAPMSAPPATCAGVWWRRWIRDQATTAASGHAMAAVAAP